MSFHCCLLFCSSISASWSAGIIGALFIPVPTGTIPRRRLPRPPRGPASLWRVRVRYFYPNLASTSVGSHSTAATSSSPPTLFATKILFSGAHGHTTAGPPQGLRGSRRRGRVMECLLRYHRNIQNQPSSRKFPLEPPAFYVNCLLRELFFYVNVR